MPKPKHPKDFLCDNCLPVAIAATTHAISNSPPLTPRELASILEEADHQHHDAHDRSMVGCYSGSRNGCRRGIRRITITGLNGKLEDERMQDAYSEAFSVTSGTVTALQPPSATQHAQLEDSDVACLLAAIREHAPELIRS